MSLEKALAENTAILTTLNASVLAQTEFLKSMAGKGGATTGDGKPATGTKTTEPKAPTMEDLRVLASAWLGVTDTEVRTKHKAQMKTILDHFGIEKATAATAEQIPEVIAAIKTYQGGGTPDFVSEGEGEGDMV